MNEMELSVVIPCYNSEQTIQQVIEEISNVLRDYTFEIICVNDNSKDGTLLLLKDLCKKYNFLKVIDFSQNFGQHAGLMAGLRNSIGKIVICLDDDGQTDPTKMPLLINKINEGYDAVYATYPKKKENFFRTLTSNFTKKTTEILLEKPKELEMHSYYALKRYIVDEVIKYNKSYPFVAGLVLRTTKNIANVEIEHKEREYGESNYSFIKLLGLWLNGFTAFSIKPLRISSLIGVCCAGIGLLYAVYSIINKIMKPDLVIGYSSLICTILFIGGMIMLMLGLIGEYIGRIYIGLNNAPQYVIKEKINFREKVDD